VVARKGGRLHRKAGTVFVISMLVMAVFACYLGFLIPDQRVNVFIGVFALYLILTAWLAIRRREGAIGRSEKLALHVGVCLCAPFAILSLQLALGLTPPLQSAIPFKGPVLIAIYGFTSVLAIAAIGDAEVVLAEASRASLEFPATYGGCASGSPWRRARVSPTDSLVFCRVLITSRRRSSCRSSSPSYCCFWMIRVRSPSFIEERSRGQRR
jgi:uncharacterized membrane protein YfcA